MKNLMNKTLFSVFLLFCFLMASQVFSQPQKITFNDLQEIRQESKTYKILKKSQKTLNGSMFDPSSASVIKININTPKAQAAMYVSAAKENYIKLDSSNFNPDLFNKFIEVEVFNFMPSDADKIRQITRGIMLINDEVFEADSTKFIESNMQNSYGATMLSVDATFYFPIEYFTGDSDIKFVIFSNQGKIERKLKRKDILKLR